MPKSFVASLATLLVVCGCARGDAPKSTAAVSDTLALASAVPAPTRAVKAGATIAATIQEAITSRTATEGQHVRAIVARNVVDDSGHVLIPGGATVTLAIAKLRAPGNAAPQDEGVITLAVSSLSVGADSYTPAATVGAVAHTVQPGAVIPARDLAVAAGTPVTIILTQPLKLVAR